MSCLTSSYVKIWAEKRNRIAIFVKCSHLNLSTCKQTVWLLFLASCEKGQKEYLQFCYPGYLFFFSVVIVFRSLRLVALKSIRLVFKTRWRLWGEQPFVFLLLTTFKERSVGYCKTVRDLSKKNSPRRKMFLDNCSKSTIPCICLECRKKVCVAMHSTKKTSPKRFHISRRSVWGSSMSVKCTCYNRSQAGIFCCYRNKDGNHSDHTA